MELGEDEPVENFQVDLHGIVEILSRHLYSSPRVFVRELLQNGVDAITARRELDPHWPGHLTITATPDGAVSVSDDGVGLTAGEVRELLATIGRSSKRDELDMQRAGYLGQFGIGVLSCFLVTDTIEVRTRSARTPEAATLLWTAHGDGTYQLTETDPLPQPGTVVTLRSRRGERWLDASNVRTLASHYGELLPIPITFSDNGLRSQLAPRPLPWRLSDAEAAQYCSRVFGFTPLATVRLEVPVAGIRGVAFVLPIPSNPTEVSKHRVYLRGMLLGESVAGLLPDWASFVRVVVDVENLRPTASRESLYEDEVLAAARRQLGEQLRRWMTITNTNDPDLLRRFIEIHRLSVSAAALRDDEVLAVARAWIPWVTTTGTATFREILRGGGHIAYATNAKAFDALRPVAAARGTTVIHAGFTYGVALLQRFAEVDPSIQLRAVTITDLVDDEIPDVPELLPVLELGARALREHCCEIAARAFEPNGTPALYVRDPGRALLAGAENRRAAAQANPVLAGLLDHDEDDWDDEDESDDWDAPLDTLVLNTLNPVVTALPDLEADLQADVIRHLYAGALLASGTVLVEAERSLFTRTLRALIERAR